MIFQGIMKLRTFPVFSQLNAAFLARFSIAAVFFIACLDLIGWLLNIPVLTGIIPKLTPMKVPTAFCFLVSAAALACLQSERFVRFRRRIALLSGAAVSAVGLLVTVAYLYELNTGRRWSWENNPFFQIFLAPTPRMAFFTAIFFLLYGCVLLLLAMSTRRSAGAAHIVLLPISMLSYLILIGHLFDIPSLHTWLKVGVALNTNIAFFGLCVAAFCVRPDTWFMNVFTIESAGAAMARRLLPFLLFLPLLIGWMRLFGERAEFFESEVGIAIVVVASTVCFLLLVWFNARSINRTDLLRRRLDDAYKAHAKLLQFSSGHSLDELLEETLNETENLTDSLIGFFHFVDPDQESLTLQNWSTRTKQVFCKAEGKGSHYAISKAGVWVDCIYQRKPVIHNDYSSLPNKKGLPEGHAQVVRELVVPVFDRDKITAILGVGNKKTNYDDLDAKVVLLMAELVWTITERKRAEEDLTQAKSQLEIRVKEKTSDLKNAIGILELERKRFNDVLEMLPAYVVLLAPDYHVPFANRFFVERFGKSEGKRCFEFLFNRTDPCENCETFKPFTTHAPHHWEWTGPDNRNYDIYDFPFTDVDGSPLVMEMGLDITERKRMEEAAQRIEEELQNSSRYVRSLIEANLDPLVTISPEGRVTDVNAATERATGRSRKQLIGTDFHDYFTQPDRAREGYRQVLREGFVRDYPLTIRNISGSTLDVLYNATVYRDQAGEIQGVFAAARDITELKKAEAALIEANEMKLLGQLTSGVAHEVRNPLNGIMAIMGALSKELSDDGRFQPYMQHMRNQVTRLTTLMEDLLVLGRPLREENMHEISMVTIVDNALLTWLQTLQTSKPPVRFIKPENSEQCVIKADAMNMAQVIINLLENAYNHSPKGAEIVCSLYCHTVANMVVLCIKDRGTGIAEDILPKIFDPFFTTRKGGTGLGLPIVRHLVEIHEGSIFAYNNTDGPGATFEVVLPAHPKN